MDYKVEAIILNSKEVGEYDRIYDIFSFEKGRQSIVAKGVRKITAKLSAGLEPITCSEIFIAKGKSLDRVTGVAVHNNFNGLKKDYKKIKFIQVILSILKNNFPENDQYPDVYSQALNFLTAVDEGDVRRHSLRLEKLCLIWNIVLLLGHQPELFHCFGCREKLSNLQEELSVSGFLEIYCSKCSGKLNAKKIKINRDSIKLLRIFLGADRKIINKVNIADKKLTEVEKITGVALEYVLERKIFL